MKLEELLKDNPEVLQAVQDAISKANEGQEDQKKHIRFTDLSEGGYVDKATYDALDAEKKNVDQKLEEASTLIGQLKKGTKADEELQGKIAGYESRVTELQSELAAARLESAIKVALLEAKTTDIDYMTYKLKSLGNLEMGEDGKIKGMDEKISSLKTQNPAFFETGSRGKEINENRLPEGDQGKGDPASLADALRMQYES